MMQSSMARQKGVSQKIPADYVYRDSDHFSYSKWDKPIPVSIPNKHELDFQTIRYAINRSIPIMNSPMKPSRTNENSGFS